MTEIMLWRRLDLPGHEIARLEALDDGWKLFGTAIFTYQRDPFKLDYVVICDATWRTKSAKVKGVIGSREIDVTVTVDTNCRWHLGETERTSIEGSLDIDLGFSPSTNLLPIRRLQLAVGDEAEVRAAWLPFPSFELEPLAQVYRRMAERTYRYESDGGSFTRTLEVNDTGFVTSYPGLWESETID
jgi:uncharacterized protein